MSSSMSDIITQHFKENGDRARVLEEPSNGAWVVYDHQKSTKFAFRILRNWDQAEEAVQETYYRAVKYFKSFDKARSFDDWFCRILARVCANMLNNNGQIPDTVEIDDNLAVEDYLSEGESPEGLVELEEWSKAMDKLKLSNRDREVLSLYFVYGHTRKDVADILSMGAANVDRIITKNRPYVEGLCR